MSKKDKKIEIQLADSQVKVGSEQYEGYALSLSLIHISEPTRH